jgi:copper chaperone
MSENTTRSYRVTGMTCAHCANAVTQEIGALPDVTDVHVEVVSGALTVTSTRPLTDERSRPPSTRPATTSPPEPRLTGPTPHPGAPR